MEQWEQVDNLFASRPQAAVALELAVCAAVGVDREPGLVAAVTLAMVAVAQVRTDAAMVRMAADVATPLMVARDVQGVAEMAPMAAEMEPELDALAQVDEVVLAVPDELVAPAAESVVREVARALVPPVHAAAAAKRSTNTAYRMRRATFDCAPHFSSAFICSRAEVRQR